MHLVTLWSVVWLSVFIAALTLFAACRVTRFVTEDTLTQPIRDWIHMKAQPRHAHPAGRAGGRAPRFWRYLSKLVTCPWCAGFWISLALTLAYFRCWLGHWPNTPASAFAFLVAVFALAWVSAILADWLDAPPPPTQQVHSGHVSVYLTQPPTPTD